MSKKLKTLEETVQRAVDVVRQSDDQLAAAQYAIGVANSARLLGGPCPQLSDWLCNALTDGGHCNESLIGLRKWETRTIVACFGWTIFFDASILPSTPQAKALSEAVSELFKAVIADRMPHLKSFNQP